MVSFENLSLRKIYGPGATTPIEFYRDVLPRSQTVDMGLGYFASTAFEALSAAFEWQSSVRPHFRIVANETLAPEDAAAIVDASGSNSPSILDMNGELFRRLWHGLSQRKQKGYQFLRFLLESQMLELRVLRARSGGIVHHKYALFEDRNGNRIASFGSMNFSSSALLANVECLHVVQAAVESDGNDPEELEYYSSLFHRTWNGHEPDLTLVDTAALTELLLRIIPSGGAHSPSTYWLGEETPGFDTAPGKSLRDYQETAIDYWWNNGRRGLWAMATGTGKTFTAIQAIKRLSSVTPNSRVLVVIVVPSTVLVNQWAEQLESAGLLTVVRAVGSKSKWETELAETLHEFGQIDEPVAVVATHQAYKSHVVSRIGMHADHTLLIVDEVHTMGTQAGLDSLLPDIRWRIALSATPIRQYDQEGTGSLISYFHGSDNQYYVYGLQDAIRDGYLCPYEYAILPVHLTQDEQERYDQLSAKIATMINSEEPEIVRARNHLLIARHRIVEQAQEKLGPSTKRIVEITERAKGPAYGIAYSPDGAFAPADDDPAHSVQWIDRLMEEIGRARIKAHRFVQGDSEEHLIHLEAGRLDWIVAKKRLDEGVDIPRAEHAIVIASSRTLRQFVQRRGRILRPHKDKRVAQICDLLVLPSHDRDTGACSTAGRSLVVQELSRAREFALAAQNHEEISLQIQELSEAYGIHAREIASPVLSNEAHEYEADLED